MTGWIIFGVIVLLFILIFTVRVRVTLLIREEVCLYVKAFGIKIGILPKKKGKRVKVRNYTKEKIAKRDEKEEKKRLKKAEKKKQKKKQKLEKKEQQKKRPKEKVKAEKEQKPSVIDLIKLGTKVAKYFFGGFFRRFHVHVARLRITVATGDAASTAILYGVILNAVSPLLAIIDRITNLHGRNSADISIDTDYLTDKTEMDICIAVSMSIGALLGVLIRSAFKFIFGYMKIKKEKEASSQTIKKKKIITQNSDK